MLQRRKKREGNFIRLVITYFGVLIPILLISFALTESSIASLQANEKKASEQRMARAVQNLSAFLSDTRQNANRFSNTSALRPYEMLKSPASVQDGIEWLSLFTLYDSNISDIAIYYGTDMIYASHGMTNVSTYFSATYACTRESTDLALAALSDRSDRIMILWQNDRSGYLMLHYSNRIATAYTLNFSINFIVSIAQFIDQMQDLLDPTLSYVNVTLPDGTQIHFGATGTTLAIVPDDQFPTDLSDYTLVSGEDKLTGIHVDALHNTSALFAGVRRNQMLNYALMAVGLLLSMFLAYIFSRFRSQQITWLEMMIRGITPTGNRLMRGEFAGLHALLLNRNRINSLQEQNLNTMHTALRMHTARMLEHGWMTDEQDAARFLRDCDIAFTTGHYCISAILFPPDQPTDTIDKMEELLVHDLSYRGTVSGLPVIYCFTEMRDDDLSQRDRLTLGKRLQEVLYEQSILNARIGISSVHHMLTDACRAYAEAQKTLEYLARETTPPGQCMCWEDIARSEPPVRLATLATDPLVNAVKTGRAPEAAAEVIRLSGDITQYAENDAHRVILRAQLLTRIGDALPKSAQQAFWRESAQIDIRNANEFERQTRSIITEYVVPPESNDLYAELAAYVDAHYTDCELTADQVANIAKITPQYLTRLFKSRAGLSYIDYVTQLRMKKACTLLRTTSLSVQEIVRQSGYLDASSFRRKFKSVFGVGVNEYRTLSTPPPIPPALLPFGERSPAQPDDEPKPAE